MELQERPQITAPPARRLPEGAFMRREVFGLEEGEVVITLPNRLSAENIEDIEAWLEIVTRKLRRMVSAPAKQDAYRQSESEDGTS